jgi:hypothetical protein
MKERMKDKEIECPKEMKKNMENQGNYCVKRGKIKV